MQSETHPLACTAHLALWPRLSRDPSPLHGTKERVPPKSLVNEVVAVGVQLDLGLWMLGRYSCDDRRLRTRTEKHAATCPITTHQRLAKNLGRLGYGVKLFADDVVLQVGCLECIDDLNGVGLGVPPPERLQKRL